MPQAVQPMIFNPIGPIACPACGGRANIMRRTPDPRNSAAEIRTYECAQCGRQIELEAAGG